MEPELASEALWVDISEFPAKPLVMRRAIFCFKGKGS